MGTKRRSSDLVSDKKKRRRTSFSKIDADAVVTRGNEIDLAIPWQEHVFSLYRRAISCVSTPLRLLSSWLFPVDIETSNSVHHVEEIMGEILSRLPVKSLLRFRCVSRTWLSLIDSEWFIATHLRNSTRNRVFSHHRVIFDSLFEVLNGCSLNQLMNEPSSIGPSPLYDPTNVQLMEGSSIMGCCNGLICLHKHQTFFLLNPATRMAAELPMFDCHIDEVIKFGFGWDGTSGAYKVIVFLNKVWGIEGSVYNSRTNSWKTVEQEDCDSHIRGVFACESIYWINERTEDFYIESFDLKSEEFGRIEPPCKSPKKGSYLQFELGEIGECLHLLCVHDDHHRQSHAIVWIMKESGWLNLFTVRLSFEPDWINHPLFGGGPNGEILLIFENNYLIYEGKDAVVRADENNFKFFEGCIYVESLVSPNWTMARFPGHAWGLLSPARFHLVFCVLMRFNFSGMKFYIGIREFLEGFRLPGEAQKIDHKMENLQRAKVLADHGEAAELLSEELFEIMDLARNDLLLGVYHMYRSANNVAHSLALSAANFPQQMVWTVSFPSWLMEAVLADRH